MFLLAVLLDYNDSCQCCFLTCVVSEEKGKKLTCKGQQRVNVKLFFIGVTKLMGLRISLLRV